jgi:hypothetical protein
MPTECQFEGRIWQLNAKKTTDVSGSRQPNEP